jgi:hypothetical protein
VLRGVASGCERADAGAAAGAVVGSSGISARGGASGGVAAAATKPSGSDSWDTPMWLAMAARAPAIDARWLRSTATSARCSMLWECSTLFCAASWVHLAATYKAYLQGG